MKVALIGAGRIGQLHGRTLATHPEVEAVLVYDVDPGRARQLAAAIGGQVSDSVAGALDGADAVVVASSTDSHPALVRAAVDRRLPTFCEKPLALDLTETRRLVEYVEERGVPVQVGFQRRFDPGYQEARRLAASGGLGTVYLVRLVSHDHEPPPAGYIPRSGGLFCDLSIHNFDVLRWVTGQEVEEVYAVGSVRRFDVFARYDDVDTGAAVLRLRDGTLAVLSESRHDPRGYDVRLEIVGSGDAVVVGLTERTPLRSLDSDGLRFPRPAWTTFLTRFEAAYRQELLVFLQVARGEVANPCAARDGLEAMRIAVAATRSRLEHRPIRLEDVP